MLAINKLATVFLQIHAVFHWAEQADRSSYCCALKNVWLTAEAVHTQIYTMYSGLSAFLCVCNWRLSAMLRHQCRY